VRPCGRHQHSGHDRQRNLNAFSTNRMLNAYNAPLCQYVVDNHYMDTLAFHAHFGCCDHRQVRLQGMPAEMSVQIIA
jgi:hypothetical protein